MYVLAKIDNDAPSCFRDLWHLSCKSKTRLKIQVNFKGVSPGSIREPLLLIIFMNDSFVDISHTRFDMHDDGLVQYVAGIYLHI